MDELIKKLRELAEHLDETDSMIVYQAIGALQAKIELTRLITNEQTNSKGIINLQPL